MSKNTPTDKLSDEGKKLQVVQPSAGLHISNDVTLLQRKSWIFLFHVAFPNMLKQEEHVVDVVKLKNFLDYRSRNDEYFKETLKGLTGTSVEWNLLGKSKRTWGAAALLADIEIIDGVCYYSYGSRLRKRLSNPDVYAKLSLLLINRFHSKSAFALWLLATDYYIAKKGYGTTGWIEINKLEKLLLGREKRKSVKEFKIFNRDVLKPAIKKVNEIAHFETRCEFRRKSRKISAVKFHIRQVQRQNHQSACYLSNENHKIEVENAPSAVLELIKLGLTRREALKIWNMGFGFVDSERRPADGEYPDFNTYLHEKVNLAQNYPADKIKRSRSALLRDAIKSNYDNPQFAKLREHEAGEHVQQKLEELNERKENVHRDYERKSETIFQKIINDDPQGTREIIGDVLAENPNVEQWYRASRPFADQHVMFQALVKSKLKLRFPSHFKELDAEFDRQLDNLDQQIGTLKNR